MAENLVTIECSRPGDPYSLFESGVDLDVHLAGPGEHGGTGTIICGFDRFARDKDGRIAVGFSVGGGVSGPGYRHHACPECAALIGSRSVSGLHKDLFPKPIFTAAQARRYLEDTLDPNDPGEPADLDGFDDLPDYVQDGGLDR